MRHAAPVSLFLCACAGILAPAIPARADEAGGANQIVVRLGTAAPDDTPWAKQLNQIKARFDKESGGRVKLKVFLGSVKGGEESMVRQCAQGSLQAIGVATGALAALAPEMNVFELPYLFKDQKQADDVLDDPEVWALVARILRAKGLEPYIFSENGWRQFASKNAPLRAPADFKGLKIRSHESMVHIETWKALGASPVPISVPEALGALQTGVVDAFDNTALFAFATSWYQAVKFWTVGDAIYQPALIVYNKKFFDAQPPEIRQLLLSNREGETQYGRGLIRKLSPLLQANLKEAGLEIRDLSAAEKKALAEATRPVYAKVRAAVSDEGKTLFDLIMKKTGKK